MTLATFLRAAFLFAGVWLTLDVVRWASGVLARWLTAVSDPRKQGRLSAADFVPEPTTVAWRRAVDRAYAATMILCADERGEFWMIDCPYCAWTARAAQTDAVNRCANHMLESHPERIEGLSVSSLSRDA